MEVINPIKIQSIIPKKNYFVNESACRCDICKSITPLDMDHNALYKFNQIREYLGAPLTMTSGKRCASHPVEFKKFKRTGAYTGQHFLGNAADIKCTGNLRYKVLVCAIALGATGIALGKTYIHIDFRKGTPTTWTY